MSPALIELLAECMHAERQAEAESERLRRQVPAPPVTRAWPGIRGLTAALSFCLDNLSRVAEYSGPLSRRPGG